jgi:HemY protein
MRRVAWAIVLALVIGGIAGTLMTRDPGYVLLVYDGRSVETSLWAALVALLLLYVVLRALVFVLMWSSRAGTRLREWDRRRRQRRATTLLERGLLQLAEGRWSEARQSLLRGVDDSDLPAINLLHAARAAHELGALEERDALLQRALACESKPRLVVALTEAELRLSSGEHAAVLETLTRLRSEAPTHPGLLRMLAGAYRGLGDWRPLLELAPALLKHQSMPAPELSSMVEQAWDGWLARETARPQQAGAAPVDTAAIRNVWRQLPGELCTPAMIRAYAMALERLNAPAEAEALLHTQIDRVWSDELVAAYGLLDMHDQEARGRQRRTAESWLRQRPDSAALLLALGRICLAAGDLPQARSYLEDALRSARSPDTYAALGQLCQRLGDYQRSAGYFALALGQDPERRTAAGPSLAQPMPANEPTVSR